MNIDLDLIRTFLAVSSSSSFNEAANKIHRSTATITYRIKQLEKEFGVILIKRNTRSFSLTKEGEYLKNKFELFINDFDHLKDNVEQIKNNIEHSIKISINELLYDKNTVINLTKYLHDKYPNTAIHFCREVYNGVWGSLLSEQSHFAIGTPGWHPINNEIESIAMGEISWIFIASPQHPITQSHGILSDDMLRKHTAINIEDTSHHLIRRKAWLLKGQREILVPDFKTKVNMHIQGIGVGYLPYNVAKYPLNEGKLITRKTANPRTNSPLSFAWRKDANGKIINELKNMFSQQNPLIMGFYKNLDIVV